MGFRVSIVCFYTLGSCCEGHFSYRIDLDAMTQENTKTGKVRAIRRFTEAAAKKATKRTKSMRPPAKKRAPAAKADKALVDRKKVLKKILKTLTSDAKTTTVAGKRKPTKPKAGPKVAMKKKAVKVAKGKDAKAQVFHGKFTRTSTGLKKSDLKRNKYGKVVSKKASEAGASF